MAYGSMTVKNAGRRGGLRLVRKRGRSWMRRIGRKGGLKSKSRRRR